MVGDHFLHPHDLHGCLSSDNCKEKIDAGHDLG